MTINIAELERVSTYLLDHPEQHVQSAWMCNTGACFAGHAALLNGWKPLVNDEFGLDSGMVVNDDGSQVHVADVARILFNLPTCQEVDDKLFIATNTAEKIALMVKDIANGDEELSRWRQRETWANGSVEGGSFYEREDEEE